MFNFNFGKTKPSIFKYAIVGVIFTSTITVISQCTRIPEEKLYDIVDEIQRKIPGKPLNDYIITDPILLDRRIKRDVDSAILEYERLTGDDGRVRMSPSYFSEKAPDGSKAQKLLGGELRICGSWVPDCPKENQAKLVQW